MANNDGGRRYAFIDGVRGIAASIVMLQHSLEYSGLQEMAQGRFALSWLNLGETGVVAFFFVSGFVIPLSLEKWNDISHFWINRAFRVYPLYFAVYATAAALAGFGGLTLSGVPLNFAAHLLFIQEFFNTPNFVGTAWTLSLEAMWYVSFTLLFALSLNKKASWFVGLAVAFALAAGIVSLSGIARLPMGRVGLLVICVFGLLCFRKERGDVSDKAFWLGAGMLVATVSFCLCVGFWLRPSTSPIAASFRCVVLSWLLAGIVFLTPFLSRAWPPTHNFATRYLGKISYSIYLVHPITIFLLAHMAITGLYAVAIVAVATVAISAMTYRYIEYPAISFSHKLRPLKVGGG